MATEAQIAANRLNAQKSTGPRTPEGKTVVSQNAVKPGLLARAAVLPGEEWEEFTCYREEMLEELYPDGVQEAELAGRIVDLSWRLRRAAQYQNWVFEALYDKHTAGPQDTSLPPEGSGGLDPDGRADNATLGRMILEDFARERVLERLLMYERRIESSLYRARAELRQPRRQPQTSAKRTAEAFSGQWERSSGHSPASPFATSDFTLQTSHGTLPTSQEPPGGVTTNAAAGPVQRRVAAGVGRQSLVRGPRGQITLVWCQKPRGGNWGLRRADCDDRGQWSPSQTLVTAGNPRYCSAVYDAKGSLWVSHAADTENGRQIKVERLESL
jgi:hypothetical protein